MQKVAQKGSHNPQFAIQLNHYCILTESVFSDRLFVHKNMLYVKLIISKVSDKIGGSTLFSCRLFCVSFS